ncbi:U-box domain-containing protein 11-like [Tripterygium wilfordii]|uniref:RING-type E3 ubiquitin transferase n=1 Tax=Tripterygium wilfordii TaxID=458696 RepID=A0A7J7C1H9_TRIWF|nr:U-box domain-containing protein 10-like [Tripterygium wilfordii]KAF5727717.1 U-box domain-containing protein 11-like [Tripterygium wilfordii]
MQGGQLSKISLAMAGGGEPALLDLVQEISAFSVGSNDGKEPPLFKKDCTDLVHRIALLTHLLEEIRDFKENSEPFDVSTISDWGSDLLLGLQAAKRLLSFASSYSSKNNSDGAGKRIAFQFQCVTSKLEKALGNIPYEHFDVSEEVQEQVQLVRTQMRRAAKRYGCSNAKMISYATYQPLDGKLDRVQSSKMIEHSASNNHEVTEKLDMVPESNVHKSGGADQMVNIPESAKNSFTSSDVSLSKDIDAAKQENSSSTNAEEVKTQDVLVIPDDFLCPISLELMRDPVIVATGQTYERSYIQRWIDSGNATCPKTQQKLENLTLTPNYVLRSLVTQWCTEHNIEQPTGLSNGKMKKIDGSFHDVSGDVQAIQTLVRKLSSRSIEECRAAVAEIRSLSKRSTDNRILLAEAGVIPVLVSLLTADDNLIQENAVTSVLNLSIFENNKGLIMLSGAIPSIVQVLRAGSREAKENAAATLFSLSLADENKIIIGASGAIPALVELLQNGSTRGKKDAATALFNLCIYQGNKGRAVRSGIVTALLKMLIDSRNCMVDEALAILSVLASNQEAKVAIVKASTLPVLIDLLRAGLPRNKENAAAILLTLCKKETDNLACISRLGAVMPLTELARSGTERAKRKATSLLEHLRKLQQP